MRKRDGIISSRRRVQAGTTVLLCIAAAAVWAVYPNAPASDELVDEESSVIEPPAPQDFSKFDHRSPQHDRMPCLLCHVRTAGSTTPKLPGHTPCAGCHVQQFADNTSAICSICHTATGLKRFPPLRSFNVMFNHAMHTRQTNCVSCHEQSRGGAGLSVPSGASAHASCFSCHTPRNEIGGRNIGSCGTCHQPGRPVRNSNWSRASAVNFNHRKHDDMNCAVCHTVLRGSSRRRQVTEPLVSMHFAPAGRASCGNCHNSRRAFGTSDFANCRRCHQGWSFRF